nr:chromosomal replication initiator protein DnaA [Anaerolineae bacterium]
MEDHKLTPAQLWQTAYGELELQLPRDTFNTWLRSARLIAHEDGTFIIGVHNIYAREWLDTRLKKVVARTLGQIARREVEIRFVLASEHPHQKKTKPLKDAGPLLAALDKPAPSPARFDYLPEGETGLNSRLTFDTLVTGKGNQLAHAAATAVADEPGNHFNPFYLYGNVGLGKTHLLHAIGNACHERGCRVLYIPSETFINDLVGAIRVRSTDDFRAKYRSVDMLLVDDIQFIAGKDSSQEEFYHTFEALVNANAQIVVAGCQPPASIPNLDHRLRSRFEGGLVIELQAPDYLTRIDILELKAEQRGFGAQIPLDVLEHIAGEVGGSIRELDGALNQVIASILLTAESPTLSTADAILNQLEIRVVTPVLTLEDIVMTTADYYGVTVEAICGRDRAREVSAARQVAVYLARAEADIPLQQIGEMLGGRSHSTILYGFERVESLMGIDSRVRRDVGEILRLLRPQQQPRSLTEARDE